MGQNMNQFLNGFGRVITYFDSKKGGTEPEYPVSMWEGRIIDGNPDGLVRYINGVDDESFIGYMKPTFRTQRGTGLFYTKRELRHKYGYYADNSVISAEPKVKVAFDHFGQGPHLQCPVANSMFVSE